MAGHGLHVSAWACRWTRGVSVTRTTLSGPRIMVVRFGGGCRPMVVCASSAEGCGAGLGAGPATGLFAVVVPLLSSLVAMGVGGAAWGDGRVVGCVVMVGACNWVRVP